MLKYGTLLLCIYASMLSSAATAGDSFQKVSELNDSEITVTEAVSPKVPGESVPYGSLSPQKRHLWKKLLHYDMSTDTSIISEDSSFFLSEKGRTDPEAEYEETIKFFRKDPHNACYYPARFYLIHDGDIPEEIIKDPECKIFSDFLDNVGLDTLKIIFVAEDALVPISAAGHIFVKAEGVNRKGKFREYSFSFAAYEENEINLVLKFFSNGINGIYSLQPYYMNVSEYMATDRSLWEFELNLTEEQKKIFYLHMLELKNHGTLYSFFSINCASGMAKALAVADDRLDSRDIVFFETPLEYISEVYHKKGMISDIELIPSESENLYFSWNRLSTPINSYPSNRLEITGLYNSRYHAGALLRYAPTLNNLKDDNISSPSLSESKLIEVSAKYMDDHFYLNEIELLNLNPLPDARLGRFTSMNYLVALHGSVDSTHAGLYPEFSLGNAVSFRMGDFIPYVHLRYGYTVPHSNNHVFVRPEGGIFFWNRDIGKINLSYEIPLTTHRYYRNYMYRYQATWSRYISHNFSANVEFTDYRLGNNDGSRSQQRHGGNHMTEAGASIVFYF